MSVVFDCLKFMRESLNELPESDFEVLARLAGKLICSKYNSHVSFGVEFAGLVLRVVSREWSTLEAVKREIRAIRESPRIQKILRMKAGERKQVTVL